MAGTPDRPAADPLHMLSPGERRRATFLLIEDLRRQHGIAQKDLCKAAGVHQTTYSRRKAKPDRWRQRHLKDLLDALAHLKAISEAERSALHQRIVGPTEQGGRLAA